MILERKEMIDRIEFLRNRLHEDDTIEALDYVLSWLKGNRPIIFFHQREYIGRLYYEWLDENKIADTPNSFVVFMEINNWLDNDKIIEDFKKSKQ